MTPIVPSGYACATPAAEINAVDRLFAAHAAILAQYRAKAVADSAQHVGVAGVAVGKQGRQQQQPMLGNEAAWSSS
jgi:hypothetical protein